jgi:hypothetical protein
VYVGWMKCANLQDVSSRRDAGSLLACFLFPETTSCISLVQTRWRSGQGRPRQCLLQVVHKAKRSHDL